MATGLEGYKLKNELEKLKKTISESKENKNSEGIENPSE